MNESYRLIEKVRSSEYILVVVGAGLSRPSGIPTFRDDPWFWERPVEEMATEAAFKQNPLYVWALYERLRLISLDALPNPGHTALARLGRAKPNLLTISQNIDDMCQKAHHNNDQLISLHGSLFRICCEDKECAYENWNHTPEPTVPGLNTLSSHSGNVLHATDVPSCPRCRSARLRPGVCWFGETLPPNELSRIERWVESAPKVDLVLVIGTERTPFVREAIAKGAEVAWLNVFDSDVADTGDDWYVSGSASETLPRLVDAVLS